MVHLARTLSIAGLRAGLKDENGNVTRSGLFDEQMRIFEIARKYCGCHLLLWENVPGAFSSNDGRDFAYILGSMVEGKVSVPSGGWGNAGVCVSETGHRIVEWHVLDAQHSGVAQRRRRLFALLDTGAWWSRPPILFESESMPGDSEKSKRAQKGTSSTVGTDLGPNGCFGWNARDIRGSRITRDSMDPLGATQYKGAPLVGYEEPDLFFSTGDQGRETITGKDEPTGTITSRIECGFVMATAIGVETQRPHAAIGIDVMPTLACSGWSHDAYVATNEEGAPSA